jgi:uncharacterized protein involved in exopolysaccharide biosynthesis
MALPLSQLPQEIIREVRQRKGLAFLLFVVVSFAVLGAGFIWPYKYQADTIIFVDDRNIIAPLMEGRAVTTKINDRTSAARELLMSRTLIERVASDPEIYRNASMDPDALEGRIAKIRSGLSVRPDFPNGSLPCSPKAWPGVHRRDQRPETVRKPQRL